MIHPRCIARRLNPAWLMALALASPGVSAQAWSVTYLETRYSAAEEAAGALAEYTESTAVASGSMGVVALQQENSPNQFVLLEEWGSEEQKNAHRSSPASSALREKLDPLMISGYDERPYVNLDVDGDLVTRPGAVFVVTHVDIGSRPRETGIDLVREMVKASREDSGSLRVMVLTWGVRNNHMTVVEIWESEADRQAHIATEHMRTFREALTPLIGSMYDERVFRAL